MSGKNSKQLVIDANLALGSNDRMFNPMGGKPGDRNRRCLLAIREEKHKAVFSLKLRQEWRAHASPSAIAWLQDMERKNLIVSENGEQFSDLLNPACGCLPSLGHKGALAKDFHLVQSALATEQLILSNERQFPQLVALACAAVKELLQLHYGNPAVEGDACILWIKAGAEKDADRRIDVWAEDHLNSN
jgi:hypothetical protein